VMIFQWLALPASSKVPNQAAACESPVKTTITSEVVSPNSQASPDGAVAPHPT